MSLPMRRHTDAIAGATSVAGRRVLEVGCGAGALLGWLRREGALPIGLDPSLALLAEARRAALDVPLVRGRGEALPFASGSLDLVCYVNSLHHVPLAAQWRAIAEVARVLGPDGELLAIEPLPEGPWFELLRAVDDETEVRQEARRALTAAATLGLHMASETFYETRVAAASWADVRDRFLAIDPGRAEALAGVEQTLANRFDSLGEPTAAGRSFAQAFRLNLLRRQRRW